MDVAQDLCDLHPGDQQVERHKQREDWSEPVRAEGTDRTDFVQGFFRKVSETAVLKIF